MDCAHQRGASCSPQRAQRKAHSDHSREDPHPPHADALHTHEGSGALRTTCAILSRDKGGQERMAANRLPADAGEAADCTDVRPSPSSKGPPRLNRRNLGQSSAVGASKACALVLACWPGKRFVARDVWGDCPNMVTSGPTCCNMGPRGMDLDRAWPRRQNAPTRIGLQHSQACSPPETAKFQDFWKRPQIRTSRRSESRKEVSLKATSPFALRPTPDSPCARGSGRGAKERDIDASRAAEALRDMSGRDPGADPLGVWGSGLPLLEGRQAGL